MKSTWLGIVYTIAGAYFLLRHRTEADRAIERATEVNWRTLFGGSPRPLPPFSVKLIRVLTFVAGIAGLLLGLFGLFGKL